MRIVETPVDGELTDAKDPRAGFIAYVPEGSLKNGEMLATGKTSTTSACHNCHGAGLKGYGPIPALAGRSPSYIARQLYDIQPRQLYDIQQSARRGMNTGMMKRIVAQMTVEDITNIAAYTASLTP